MAFTKTSIAVLALTFLLCTLPEATAYREAKEYLVGGNEISWTIPSSNDSLNEWARKTMFLTGDTLTFRYDGKTDSVLEVTKEDYEACETSKPIKEYKDGNTKIRLERDRLGPNYFISGAQGHCEKGQKVELLVELDPNWYLRSRATWNDVYVRQSYGKKTIYDTIYDLIIYYFNFI